MHISNLRQVLNILKRKITLIGYVFSNLEIPKYLVNEMSKKPRLRTPCDSEHVKQSEKLTTSLPSYCFITLAKIDLENTHLSVSEIVGVFVNTSTVDNKYSLRKRKNLQQPIQLQLCRKRKYFSEYLAAYLKSTSYIVHFEKNDDTHRLYIFQIRDCKRCG